MTKDKKYKTTVYRNGVGVRMKNRRITISESEIRSGGYALCFYSTIPKEDLKNADKPHVVTDLWRGKVRFTQLLMSAEGMDAIADAWNKYKDRNTLKFTWKKANDSLNESISYYIMGDGALKKSKKPKAKKKKP